MDKRINDKAIQCGCGMIVTGKSKLHTESNLKVHKKSKAHKKNIKLILYADKSKIKKGVC